MTFHPHFDGDTYDPDRDHKRLTGQLARVFNAVRDGKWHTLHEIAEKTDSPPQSVSARLRDLRKSKFGAFTVERRRDLLGGGTFEYRLGVVDG